MSEEPSSPTKALVAIDKKKKSHKETERCTLRCHSNDMHVPHSLLPVMTPDQPCYPTDGAPGSDVFLMTGGSLLRYIKLCNCLTGPLVMRNGCCSARTSVRMVRFGVCPRELRGMVCKQSA